MDSIIKETLNNIYKLMNIYLNIYSLIIIKNTLLFLNVTSDITTTVSDNLIFCAIIPDCFLIFIVIYFLLYICFYNKYSLNLIFNKWLVMYIIIFLFIELMLLIKLYTFNVNLILLNNCFIINNFTISIKIVLIAIVILFLLSMYDNLANENYMNIEVPIIILISLVSMFWLISSNDLMVMFLSLELQSLALYVICCVKKYSNLAVEAGLKYFILGSYASAMLAFGISIIYGFLGTTNYYEIFVSLYSCTINTVPLTVYFATACIFAGLLFKLGIMPFHLWIADVYEGSPNIITYFFAVVPKISIVVVFFRLFFFVFFNLISVFSFFLLICSVSSIFFGSVLALYQVKIKRLFAYSAIVHMGYILLAISLGSFATLYVALYYLLVYVLVSINVFTIFLILYRGKGSPMRNIVDISYISHSNFFLAILFSLSVLSVAGIPPLAGFFGKVYVFSILVETGNYYLSLFIVLVSVLSCAYYIRLIRFILFRERNDKTPVLNYIKITEIQSLLLVFLFFINFFFLFLQSPIILTLDNILLSLIVWQ